MENCKVCEEFKIETHPARCKVCGRDHFLVHSEETVCDVCCSWAIYVEDQLKNEGYAKNFVRYAKEDACAHLAEQTLK
jgi:hypothetical protein